VKAPKLFLCRVRLSPKTVIHSHHLNGFHTPVLLSAFVVSGQAVPIDITGIVIDDYSSKDSVRVILDHFMKGAYSHQLETIRSVTVDRVSLTSLGLVSAEELLLHEYRQMRFISWMCLDPTP